MKTITTILLLLLCSVTFAQEQKFLIEGKIVDEQGNPVTDVYIVNLNNHDKDISHPNGIFAIWVSPGDSLILSHISYFRKIVSVQTMLVNPIVTLESEHVDIPEVRVSPSQISDLDRAKQNLQQNKWDIRSRPGDMSTESQQMQQVITANNNVLRAEASSVSIVKFSPSENIGKLFTKLKKKDQYERYSSTRKTLEEVEKEKNK